MSDTRHKAGTGPGNSRWSDAAQLKYRGSVYVLLGDRIVVFSSSRRRDASFLSDKQVKLPQLFCAAQHRSWKPERPAAAPLASGPA